MKLLKVFTIMLIALAFMSVTAFGQITGSDHDFSNENWNGTGEICVVCHTPHNADVSVNDAPLWNHEVTSATFTPYSSATLDAGTNGQLGQPNGISKLCLSCHDGTVAIDNFGGTTNGTETMSGNDLIGTDLSDDHPVSFTYDAALASADGGLYDPTTTSSNITPNGTIDEDMLFNKKLECASCHDVHNGSGVAKLLRKSNASSALCLTCHAK